MNSGLSLAFAVCLSAGATAATAAEEPAQDVILTPETPVVDISPGRPGRQLVELPALEYTFDVEARCPVDWTPESLSLNVADSRVTIGAGELSARGDRKVVLKVPAGQLAPITINDFCVEAATAPGLAADRPRPDTPRESRSADRVTIPAVFSAHASLLCRSELEPRITYVSLPLDVTLSCNAGRKPTGL